MDDIRPAAGEGLDSNRTTHGGEMSDHETINQQQMEVIARHMAGVAHQAFVRGFSAGTFATGGATARTDYERAEREAGFYAGSGFEPDYVRDMLQVGAAPAPPREQISHARCRCAKHGHDSPCDCVHCNLDGCFPGVAGD
jgi:hypothetical protein